MTHATTCSSSSEWGIANPACRFGRPVSNEKCTVSVYRAHKGIRLSKRAIRRFHILYLLYWNFGSRCKVHSRTPLKEPWIHGVVPTATNRCTQFSIACTVASCFAIHQSYPSAPRRRQMYLGLTSPQRGRDRSEYQQARREIGEAWAVLAILLVAR